MTVMLRRKRELTNRFVNVTATNGHNHVSSLVVTELTSVGACCALAPRARDYHTSVPPDYTSTTVDTTLHI